MVAKKTARIAPTTLAKAAKAAKTSVAAEAAALQQDAAADAAVPASAALQAPLAQSASPAATRNQVKVNAARSGVKQVKVVDTDLVLVMEDGSTVYVRDGAVQAMVDRDFAVAFSDGVTVSGQDMLHAAEAADVGRIAITGTVGDGLPGGVVTDAPAVPATPAPAAKSPKWQTYALIGAPLIGGAVAGTLGKGSSTTATTTQSTGSGGTTVATKTATPVIQPINGTNVINAASKAAGVTINGTAEANATVTVLFGTTQKTATADANGRWSVSYAAADLPADAALVTISASAKSATASASDLALRDVRLDTAGPLAPTINPLTGDNVLSPTEQQSPVTVSGLSEANATVKLQWGSTVKFAVANEAGVWSATFDTAELPKTPGSTDLTATATDTAGNPGATATQAVTISPAVDISGTVTAGRILSGNGLVVSIYSGDGKTLLATNVKVNASGGFSVSGLAIASGQAVIAVVTDTNDAADYLDEATGLGKSLGSSRLLATGIVTGASLTLNINPLTTLAAQKAGLAEDGSGSVTAAKVATANQQVSEALGLGSTDITQITPVATNSGSYNPADGLSTGEKAGALLAALSGADAINGGSPAVTLANLLPQVSGKALSATGQAQVVAGAVKATPSVGSALQSAVSDVVAQTSAATQLTIGTVAGDNVINAREVSGLQLTGTVAAGATAVNLAFGNLSRGATISGTTWSYTVTADDLAGLGGDGVRVINATATLAGGGSATASRAVTLATAAVAAPRIDTPGGDGWINASEAAAGVSLSGTGTAGTTVALNWGNAPAKSAKVGDNGRWSVDYSSAEIPTAATSTVSATATDQFGNTSDQASATARYDVAAPADPTIRNINSGNVVRLSAQSTGVTLQGTGEPGATVSIVWGTRFSNSAVPVNADGSWSLTVQGSELPSNGLVPVRVTQTDAAGNRSSEVTLPVTVAINPPAAPTAILSVAGDNIVNADEARGTIQVKGKATFGQTVVVRFGSFQSRAVVDADGNFTANFSATSSTAGIPLDGTYTVTAYAIDADNNVSPTYTYPTPVVVNTSVGKPSISAFAEDGKVSLAEQNGGFTVTGQCDADVTTVQLILTSVTDPNVVLRRTGRPDGRGGWTVQIAAGDTEIISGAWTAQVQVTDNARNTATSDALPVVVDLVPPATPGLSPINTNNTVGPNGRTDGVLIEGTGEVGASVVLEWRLGNTLVLSSAGTPIVVGTNGKWSYQLQNSAVPADNTYSLVVRQSDAAGNVSDPATAEVLVKTSGLLAPTVRTFAGDDAATAVINAAERAGVVTVSGTAPAGSLGNTVSVTLNGQKAEGRVVSGPNGLVWSASFAAGAFANLGNGTYTATVSMRDTAGNESITPASVNVTVDATINAPVLNAATLAGDGVINIAERDGGFDLSFTTDTDVTTAYVTVGGVRVDATAGTTAGTAKTWTARVASLTGGTFNTDNTVNLTISATDGAGNAITTPVRKITTDFVAPSGTLNITPVSGGYLNATELAGAIMVNGGGATAGAKVRVYLGTAYQDVTATGSGTWSATFDTAANKPTGTPGGTTVAVTAQEFDAAGNGGPIAQASVIADSATVKPVILGVVTNAATGQVGKVVNAALKTAGLTIKGTAEADATVEVSWGGTSLGSARAAADGTWTLAVDPALVPTDGAAVNITATAADAAGNASVAATAVPIRIDTVSNPPAITQFNGAAAGTGSLYVNAATMAGTNVAVQGTAEIGGTGVLKLLRNGVQVGGDYAIAPNSAGNWSVALQGAGLAPDGTYTLVTRLTDSAGNVSTEQSRTLIVDRTAPAGLQLNPVATDNDVTDAERRAGVTITGSGEVGSVADVTWNGLTLTSAKITAPANNPTATTGTWTVTFDPGQVPAATATTVLPVSVRLRDDAGNLSPAATQSVTVQPGDARAPTLATFAGDNIVNATEKLGTLTVSGTVVDASHGLEVRFHPTSTTSTDNDVVRTIAPGTSRSWSITLTDAEKARLPDGEYTLTITDTTLNLATSATVQFDTAIAVPVLTSAAHGTTLSLYDVLNGFDVVGTATIGNTVVVKLVDATKTVVSSGSQTLTSTTGNGFRITIPKTDLSALRNVANGTTYRLVLQATSAGGSTSNEVTQLLSTDYTLPTIQSFSTSTPDGFYGPSTSIVITATMSQSVKEGATMTVTLSSGSSVTLTRAAGSGAGTTLTGTYTVSAGQNAARLTVTGVTSANIANLIDNTITTATVPTSNLSTRAITIDTTPNSALNDTGLLPVPATITGSSVVDPGASNTVATSQRATSFRLTLPNRASFAVGDLIEVIDTANNNRVLASYTVTASVLTLAAGATTGTWNGPATLVLTGTTELAAGSYTLQVRVTDVAGNAAISTAAKALTLQVDQTAPVVDLNGAQAGQDYAASFTPDGTTPLALVASTATVADALGSETAGAGSGISQIRVAVVALGQGTLAERLSLAGVTDLAINRTAADSASGWQANGLTSAGAAITSLTFTLGGVAWSGTYDTASQTFIFTPVAATTTTRPVVTTAQAQALLAALRYLDPNSGATAVQGARAFAIRAVDAAGNIAAAVNSVLTFDGGRPTAAAINPIRGIDTNGDGRADNQFRISFNEAVQVAAVTDLASWTGAGVLGSGARIVALNAFTANGISYASQFRIEPGSGATYQAGQVLSLAAARAIGTGGASDVATSDVTFTIPPLTAQIGSARKYWPSANNTGADRAGDVLGYANATETGASNWYTGATGIPATGMIARIALNGVALTPTPVQLDGTGSFAPGIVLNSLKAAAGDGAYIASMRLEDPAGNISGLVETRKFVIDRTSPTVTGMVVTTPGSSPEVTITFSEPVRLTAANLDSRFGTVANGLTITPVAGFTPTVAGSSQPGVFSNTYKVKFGDGSAVNTGSPVVFTGLTDMAGNTTASQEFLIRGDFYNRPTSAPLIGNITSDNVITATEGATSQTLAIGVPGGGNGTGLTLYYDGRTVGTFTLNSQAIGGGTLSLDSAFSALAITASATTVNGTPTVTFSLPPGLWGSDGEHVFNAMVGTDLMSAAKSVYVSTQSTHWSQVAAGTIWFDPDTLVGRVGDAVTSWVASAGPLANGSPLRMTTTTTATATAQLARDALGHQQIYLNGAALTLQDTTLAPSLVAGAFTNLHAIMQLNSTGTGNVRMLTSYLKTANNFVSSTIDIQPANNSAGYNHGYSGGGIASNQNLWALTTITGDGSTLQVLRDNILSYSTAISAINANGRGSDTFVLRFGLDPTTAGTTSLFQGMIGDQIIIPTAITNALAQEIAVYLAAKYDMVGSVVAVRMPTTGAAISYDLSNPGGDPAVIDQILNTNVTWIRGVNVPLGTGIAPESFNDVVTVAGSDYVTTGQGSDTFLANDLRFRLLDGGVGFDTFTLSASYSNAASGSVFNLSDYVSNRRGMSGVVANDARVNANGYHELRGIERLDFSLAPEAQTVRLTFADIDQLAEKNLATDPNRAPDQGNLYLRLGANDRLDPTGLGAVSYGYWLDSTGQAYDRLYLSPTGSDANDLFVSGGVQGPSFAAKLSSISRSATALTFELDQPFTIANASGLSVNSGGATISGMQVDAAGKLAITGTGLGGTAVLDLSLGNAGITNSFGDAMRWTNLAIGTAGDDQINLQTRTNGGYAILGQGGNDLITGTGSSDLIISGSGNDTITGGGGADWFRIMANDSGRDTITDFRAIEGDKLDLRALLANVAISPSTSNGAVTAVQNMALVATGANEATLYIDTGGLGTLNANAPYGIVLQNVTLGTNASGATTIGTSTGDQMSLLDLINRQVVLIG